MKKLMIATMTAGLAVGAFADYSPISELKTTALNFEGGTAELPYDFGDDAVNWVNIAEKNTVKAYESAPAVDNKKYLHLDTDGEDVYRAFDNPTNWGAGTTNAMTMGGNLWIDTKVKFTASAEAPALDAGAKFALWLKEIEGESESTYELHALCGSIDGGGNTIPADIVLVANVTPAEWHRLVIRPDWDEKGITGFFTVTLDDTMLAAAEGTVLVHDSLAGEYSNAALIAERKFLPSRVSKAADKDANQIAAVGFNGTGDIDDFKVTNTYPYYVPTKEVVLTETQKTVNVGDPAFTLVATVLPENATDKTISWEVQEGKEGVITVDENGLITIVGEGTAVVTAHAAEEGTATCTVTVNAGSIDVVVPTSEMWTATVDPASGKAGDTITVTYTAKNGKLFKDGKPTLVRTGTLKPDGSIAFTDGVDTDTEDAKASIGSVLFLTLNAAIEAVQADQTIVMLADATLASNTTVSVALTLDMNGNTFTVPADKELTVAAAIQFSGAADGKGLLNLGTIHVNEDLDLSGLTWGNGLVTTEEKTSKIVIAAGKKLSFAEGNNPNAMEKNLPGFLSGSAVGALFADGAKTYTKHELGWFIEAEPVITLSEQIAEYKDAAPSFPAVTVQGFVEDTDYTTSWNPAEIAEPAPGATNEYVVTVTMIGEYSGSATATFKVWKAEPMFLGSGTEADPFQIWTVTDLKKLDELVDGGEAFAGKYFKQMADIDFVGVTDWSGIGTVGGEGKTFSGVYDGDNKKITGITTTSTVNYSGILFNNVDNAEIKNLTVGVYANATGGFSAFGGANNTTFSNVVVKGTILGTHHCGGFTCFGQWTDQMSTYIDCTNEATVASSKSAGGFCGKPQTGATFIRCVNKGTIGAEGKMGGLGGFCSGGSYGHFTDCTNEGVVLGSFGQFGSSAPTSIAGTMTARADQFAATAVFDGLNFATVADNVATLISNDQVVVGGAYKVMSPIATIPVTLDMVGQTIAFDDALNTAFDATITADGVAVTTNIEGTVTTYTAIEAPTPGEDWPVDPTVTEGSDATATFPNLPAAFKGADAGLVAAWAKGKGGVAYADMATASIDAFLLDCAANEVETEAAKFKIISIDNVGGEWIVKVTGEKTEGENYTVNAKVEIFDVTSTIDSETAVATGAKGFFKAKLVPFIVTK